jgi:hypothetical protein
MVSFVAGMVAPARFLLLGVCFGWAILAAHALSTETGMMIPRYQTHAPSAGDWATMTMLVIPTLVAAFVGSRAAAGVQSST